MLALLQSLYRCLALGLQRNCLVNRFSNFGKLLCKFYIHLFIGPGVFLIKIFSRIPIGTLMATVGTCY